jgi:hypothetical protein
MPVPNDAPSLPPGTSITVADGGCDISPVLLDLLVDARQDYDWPQGTGAAISQGRIIALEATVSRHTAALGPASAHQIVIDVSRWAGNNALSHHQIVAANAHQQATMQAAINDLLNPATAPRGIDALCMLPGVSLVIASKIYRFCSPAVGAAVDRHASYFFNSLSVTGGEFATHFRREWANARHTGSRMAIYNCAALDHNKTEYRRAYLPLLDCISSALNRAATTYQCAATGAVKTWTPADVEMAAYYWWARNGAR